LGADATVLHRALAEDVLAARVDLAFVCGPNMTAMQNTLPRSRRGAAADRSAELARPLLDGVAPGDVVMVKGSLGMAMAPIVEALLGLGENGTPAATAR
jgi:UDP-N-acetylmuramyl pentapeptide synthase